MAIQNIRFLLLSLLIIIVFLLFDFWETEKKDTYQNFQKVNVNENNFLEKNDSLNLLNKNLESKIMDSKNLPSYSNFINIKTDLYNVKIDLNGGNIVFLELLKYPISNFENSSGFILFDTSDIRNYYPQSGLLDEKDINFDLSNVRFFCKETNFIMDDSKNLYVDLNYITEKNIHFIKRYCFKANNYLINIEHIVINKSNESYYGYMYGKLKQTERQNNENFLMMSAKSYIGGAMYTPEKHYKKISFSDIKDNKKFNQQIFGGWIAMVEHYFLSAWIPSSFNESFYCSEKYNDYFYGLTYIYKAPLIVESGDTKSISADLYAGPQVAEDLKNISDGLKLTIDYGILWPIAQPIFWLLKKSYAFFENWGFAIIITTFIIKLLFYKLSASSYRSMGKMKSLQPRINLIKENCGDDKTKFSKAIMDLYKQEKVNPLGGCLSVLVQIPVFISLYYVLLESVELRHAKFIFWINDLSSNDPFYILPILMGISMYLQQKLNPVPIDPIQAKIMSIMPLMFSFLCFQFPSGLVLYWFVNNVLSILQQFFIVKNYN